MGPCSLTPAPVPSTLPCCLLVVTQAGLNWMLSSAQQLLCGFRRVLQPLLALAYLQSREQALER